MSTLKPFILDSFPKEAVGPVLVTYQGGDPSGFNVAWGYMRAAERLAKSLDKAGMDAGDDMLAFPLLFLIRHSLELGLKGYLAKLISHRNKQSCGNLRPINPRVLGVHPLIPLYDAIVEAIKDDKLHSNFKEFSKYKELIYGLDETDLSSETLRYTKTKDGEVCLYFHEQRYVIVERLLHACDELLNQVNSYAENSVFDLCSNDAFRKDGIQSYKTVKQIYALTSEARAELNRGRKHVKPKNGIAFNANEYFENSQINHEFYAKFYSCVRSIVPTTKLIDRAHLAFAIEIVKGHDSGVSYFLKSGERFIDRYISDNLSQLGSPIVEERAIGYADSVLGLKVAWKPPK